MRPTTARSAADGRWVLYWMIAARRTGFSFALQHAADRARELGRPLIVLEALRSGYPWASDRLHRFVLDGMADTRRRLAGRPVAYHPYVEPEHGAGRGLLTALAADAALVVTDEFPTFFLPRMVAAAAERLAVRLEAVDGNGLLPMAAADRAFPTAYAFRRFLQRELPAHLETMPLADPLAEPLPDPVELPAEVRERWPAASDELLAGDPAAVAALPIDHRVPATPTEGGAAAAERRLESFLEHRLARYADDRNAPDDDATSGLSPYLHFGHLGAHQVFVEIAARERWDPGQLGSKATGQRQGWWGMSEAAEAFLDQLVTWRELGFNICFHDAGPRPLRVAAGVGPEDPRGARRTIPVSTSTPSTSSTGGPDPRRAVERRPAAAAARRHDPQLPAHAVGQEDPRVDPGAARGARGDDRAQQPVRPRRPRPELALGASSGASAATTVRGVPSAEVFGTVRYMSSKNTARKMSVAGYLERYREEAG